VYNWHLQWYVDHSSVTTAILDKKEEMNLLLFNDSKWPEKTRAKEILDSLYKKKKIQPLLLVAMSGQQSDYGLEESDEK
jgi:enterochelin esterase-like enzyme